MRECSRCEKEYEDYGQRASHCRPCKRVYDREYHAKRSTSAKKQKQQLQKARRAGLVTRLRKWKGDKGCQCCSENDPVCLDMHHLDPLEKDFTIGANLTLSWDNIMAECSKCIVVCANCHRKIHAGVIEA